MIAGIRFLTSMYRRLQEHDWGKGRREKEKAGKSHALSSALWAVPLYNLDFPGNIPALLAEGSLERKKRAILTTHAAFGALAS